MHRGSVRIGGDALYALYALNVVTLYALYALNVMTFLHISLPKKGQQYNRLDCSFFLLYKCDDIVTYKFT
jgi:hypothetical protein